MRHGNGNAESAWSEQWLAVLEHNGVSRPRALEIIAVPGMVVQLTKGEPSGRLELQASPGNVLMVNLSPVQDLRQVRNQRCFLSIMLPWEMTLMPCGTPSKWSWNSTCDRLDVVIFPDSLGNEHRFESVDLFLFRDCQLADLSRKLCRELSQRSRADRLYVESLAIDIASVLLGNYSMASGRARTMPLAGMPRSRERHVIEYIEANLGQAITIHQLAGVANLSPYHFVRMFKKTLGVTPYQYVLERRMERAQERLQHQAASLSQVALEMGFCNQSHFTSAFHHATGLTPGDFQRLVAGTLGLRKRQS